MPHKPLQVRRSVSAADKIISPYLCLPFDVPDGVTRFDLHLDYPQGPGCVIDLGLGDSTLLDFPSPSGLVGWSGGARSRVFIGVDASTPGYRPGIVPGRWTVVLGLYRVPEAPVDVTIDITFDTTPRSPARAAPPPRVVRKEPGWYRGDLQCHTFHSDAGGAPEHLHATAQREGLDFLAVTDHNTTTAHPAYFDTASSPALLFLPAYEFTTEWGHANAFGAREVADFRCETGKDVTAMIEGLRAAGHLVSINHDKPDHPWLWPLPPVDAMEVWQAPWLAGNHVSLGRWHDRLAAGLRLTAIGGSDFHQPGFEPPDNPATLARPTTFVHCEELSIDGVLDGIRAGRTFVTESPDGPRVILRAGDAIQGAEVAGSTAFAVETEGAGGEALELWDATGRIACMGIARDAQTLRFTDLAPRGFLRAQIVADASRPDRIAAARKGLGTTGGTVWEEALAQPILRALSSPIWVG